MSWSQAANPQLVFIDDEGNPVANGFVQTARSVDPNQPKLVAKDPTGTIFFGPLIELNQWGMIPGPSYWEDDEPYWIRILKADGETPVGTYPIFSPLGAGGGGTDVTTLQDFYNFSANPQFFDAFSFPSPLPASAALAPGGWNFAKSNTSATDNITFPEFVIGQEVVPGNPLVYLNFACSAAGTGETFKQVFVPIGDVTAFSNQEISLGIWLMSSSESTVEFSLRQFFGTGSNTPSINVDTDTVCVLTPTWTQYEAQFTVPDVSGKTIGNNGDDQLYLMVKLPLNQTCQIGVVNQQYVSGEILPDFAYESYNEVAALTRGALLPVPVNPNNFASLVGAPIVVLPNGQLGYGQPNFFTGEIKFVAYDVTENTGPWTGWLKISSDISRILLYSDYPLLGSFLGNIWGGNGIDTFGLPPLGAAFPMVSNPSGTVRPVQTVGQTPGAETVTLTQANLPVLGSGYVFNGGTSLDSSGGSHLGISNGSSTPFSIIPPACVLCAMIKF